MTKSERDSKVYKLKLYIADRCLDIKNLSQDLKLAEDEDVVLKLCRKIEDHITDIRRNYEKIEELNATKVEEVLENPIKDKLNIQQNGRSKVVNAFDSKVAKPFGTKF